MYPRPYQHEDLQAIATASDQGERRQLAVQATGLGKTVLIANLFKYVDNIPGREIIIVDREELVWQTADKVAKYNPTAKVGIEKAEYRHDCNDDIIIACVQSLRGSKETEGGYDFGARLRSINPETIGKVVVDEAHGSISETYQQVLRWLRVYKNEEQYNDPGKLLLGLTATPNRADNRGLDQIYSKVVCNRDLIWAIGNGWLCDIEGYRVNTTIDISDVSVHGADFSQEQLAKKIDLPERNKLVVSKYLEIASGKKAIFFTLDIAHAENIAAELRTQGVPAMAISSRTPKSERPEILRRHKAFDLTALAGAMILTTGYDDPTVEVACMVRPTKSGLLYRQSVGRVLRPCPSPEDLYALRSRGEVPAFLKATAKVIDFVDVSSRHQLVTAPTLFGLNPGVDLGGKRALKTMEEFQGEIAKLPPDKQALVPLDKASSLTELSGTIEKIDLITPPVAPPELAGTTNLNWLGQDGNYRLSTKDASYQITTDTVGTVSRYKVVNGIAQFQQSHGSIEQAIRAVESSLDANQLAISRGDAKWRKDKPTLAQMELMWKKDRRARTVFSKESDYHAHLEANYSKGQVSNMLSSLLTRR